MTNSQKPVLKRNSHATMVGSVLVRPGYIKPPKPQTSKLEKALKLIAEIEAAQAKIDEKFAKIRFPFLLTNPDRRSVREKASGLIRLHQCCASKVVGKLSKCNCEFVSPKDAATLKKHGQAGDIADGREERPDQNESIDALVEAVFGTVLPGTSGMQLYISVEEWEALCQMWEFDRAEKARTAYDKKWVKQRQKTFESKTRELVKRFTRLLDTQELGTLEDSVVLEVLKTGAAIELFTNKIAKYSAKQLVEEYWELVLDLEDMHEEFGEEVVLRDPKTDFTEAKANAPKTEAEIRAALEKGPDAIIDVDMDISGLSHSSGRTDVYFSKHRASKGEKPRGATKKWESGGFATCGETGQEGITNIQDIARHEVDTDGAPVSVSGIARRGKPSGASPDTAEGADDGE